MTAATCSGCPARWHGLNVAHCSVCHESFSTVANFDRHRTYDAYGDRACLRPTDVGLVLNGRSHWSQPPSAYLLTR